MGAASPASVGEYRLLREIGSGGMGTVYEAVHPVIGKRAAVKLLHPALSVDRGLVDRFMAEGRAANQIGHDNIVDIFSCGYLEDGRAYLVMDWIPGVSLRELIKAGALTPSRARAILRQLVDTVAAAHRAGIVHRDLKPDNIMVTTGDEGDQIKLLDFGIAKLMGERGINRTQTGELLGTPAYLAPEQARSEPVDERADLYAIGIIAYELIAGRHPFAADNPLDMLFHHVYTEAEPLADSARVSVELGAVVDGLLAKDPAKRPGLDRVAHALEANEWPLADAQSRRASRGPWKAVVGAAAGAVIVAGGLVLWLAAHPGEDTAAPEELTQTATPALVPPVTDAAVAEVAEPEVARDSRADAGSAEGEPAAAAIDAGTRRDRSSRRGRTPRRKPNRGGRGEITGEGTSAGEASSDPDYTINPF